MVKLRFPNSDTERKAIGYLAGRYSFKTFAEGYTLVPEAALPALALANISFSVDGRASYEHVVPQIRDSAAPAV
ncbi:MAG: hypothetical protein U0805_20785 [Pirellulales bacterium]